MGVLSIIPRCGGKEEEGNVSGEGEGGEEISRRMLEGGAIFLKQRERFFVSGKGGGKEDAVINTRRPSLEKLQRGRRPPVRLLREKGRGKVVGAGEKKAYQRKNAVPRK